MSFLHTAFPTPLVHRDLKSLNLLISKGWTLKISDFGLSRFKMNDITEVLVGKVGTYHWMAPEVSLSTSIYDILYTRNYDIYLETYFFFSTSLY